MLDILSTFIHFAHTCTRHRFYGL